MAKHVVMNVTDGPRVLNSVPPVTLAAGAITDDPVEITDAELKSATATGWFEVEEDSKPKKSSKKS